MSDIINDGGPAFPVAPSFISAAGELSHPLRDYFAAKALQGLAAQSSEDLGRAGLNFHHTGDEVLHLHHCENMARVCYAIADAMLAEREKPKERKL
jgi:hypothetical protein